VTTPTLATGCGAEQLRRARDPQRGVPRVVRGPCWLSSGRGPLSFLYYGVAPRCATTPSAARGRRDASATGAPRIWLGPTTRKSSAVVDEALPYEGDVRGFIRSRCRWRGPRSGLRRWARTISAAATRSCTGSSTRWPGPRRWPRGRWAAGPYDVIRDGVDGLLARNKAEWRDQLRRLAASPRCERTWPAVPGNGSWPSTTSVSAPRSGPTRSAGPPSHAGRGALRVLTPGLAEPQVQERSRRRVRGTGEPGPPPDGQGRSRRGARDSSSELRGDRDVCWPEEAADQPRS
jgi:hypothetical protein